MHCRVLNEGLNSRAKSGRIGCSMGERRLTAALPDVGKEQANGMTLIRTRERLGGFGMPSRRRHCRIIPWSGNSSGQTPSACWPRLTFTNHRQGIDPDGAL
jgi:hypothetical protein